MLLRNTTALMKALQASLSMALFSSQTFRGAHHRHHGVLGHVGSNKKPDTNQGQTDPALYRSDKSLRHRKAKHRTVKSNCRERAGVILSFRLVRSADIGRLYFLRFTVVPLLISVAICFAIGLFVLVQVPIAI